MTVLKVLTAPNQKSLEQLKFIAQFKGGPFDNDLKNCVIPSWRHLEVSMSFNRTDYDEDILKDIQKVWPLTTVEESAGACVLCRCSGVTHNKGQFLANGYMWVSHRNGEPLPKDTGSSSRGGVWMPCIHGGVS